MWNDIKYLLAYILPLSAFAGIYLGGTWTFAAVIIGFVLIPLLEQLLPGTANNASPLEEEDKLKSKFFDWLLYLNVPLLYGLLGYYFYTLSVANPTTLEIIGMTTSMGLIVGTTGINVGHELGHRSTRHEQFLAKLLLLPALYLHFNIEHNRGHHKHVATEADPTSARFGESLYAFWLRSVFGSYRNAWKLEAQRLHREKKSALTMDNLMIQFQIAQVLYLVGVGLLFGWNIVPFAIVAAISGFLLLESVNYIEHYGLRRMLLPNGRYENVSPRHSWNSDHELGRIFLYELTRHSDHHYKASRKYQVLRHLEESPQLPLGYPASILTAMLPPLWFRMMNQRVPKIGE